MRVDVFEEVFFGPCDIADIFASCRKSHENFGCWIVRCQIGIVDVDDVLPLTQNEVLSSEVKLGVIVIGLHAENFGVVVDGGFGVAAIGGDIASHEPKAWIIGMNGHGVVDGFLCAISVAALEFDFCMEQAHVPILRSRTEIAKIGQRHAPVGRIGERRGDRFGDVVVPLLRSGFIGKRKRRCRKYA